jgi:CubicO group peptidase (beta-lactamase class C family)
LLVTGERSGLAPHLRAALIRGGVRTVFPSGDDALLFDLASLTKPLCTGMCAMALAGRRALSLDEPVKRYLPELSAAAGSATVVQLLDHSAGLPAWRPLFRAVMQDAAGQALYSATAGADERREGFRAGHRLVLGEALAVLPEEAPGARALYSDVGFLWLQAVLERVSQKPLDVLYGDLMREARCTQHPRFFDLKRGETPTVPCAPTGELRPRPPVEGQEDALRGTTAVEVGLRPGEVDDDNAYAEGGVAGHAGLFGTAAEAAEVGQLFLEDLHGARRLVEPSLAERFVGPSGPGKRGLAWDRPARKGSSLGTRLGRGRRGAVGHLGFTGCSLWIDLDRELVVALVSNRVLPDRRNDAIRGFRPRFHDAVAQSS